MENLQPINNPEIKPLPIDHSEYDSYPSFTFNDIKDSIKNDTYEELLKNTEKGQAGHVTYGHAVELLVYKAMEETTDKQVIEMIPTDITTDKNQGVDFHVWAERKKFDVDLTTSNEKVFPKTKNVILVRIDKTQDELINMSKEQVGMYFTQQFLKELRFRLTEVEYLNLLDRLSNRSKQSSLNKKSA